MDISPSERLEAYRALLRLPPDDGLPRTSHLTQMGAADRHPRIWLQLLRHHSAELGVAYDETKSCCTP